MKISLSPILFLVGSIWVTSCKIQPEGLIGTYIHRPNVDVYSRIRLESNNHFYYYAKVGLAFHRSEGSWKVKGRKLILHSDTTSLQLLYIPFEDEVWKIKGHRYLISNFQDGRNKYTRDK